MLVAAVVVGCLRNFSEGALFRSIGDTTHDLSLLRAHALRTTVNQAAVFGGPFVGLLLFRVAGTDAVMIGICVVLTIPVVRIAQNRVGAISTFIVAISIQGIAVILFADARAAILGPLIYCLFLLSNSAAAASLNGARAAEVEHDHQGLLNMALPTVGMIGFIAGVLIAGR